MPNWVNNAITVKCRTKGQRDAMKAALLTADGGFSYETLIPSPKTKKECPKDCLNTKTSHITTDDDRPWFDWYTWNNRHWGVKWDACEVEVREEDSMSNPMAEYEEFGSPANEKALTIRFDSPWGTPDPVFSALCDKVIGVMDSNGWPRKDADICIEFIEEQGTEYVGRLTWDAGFAGLREYIPYPGSKEAHELMFAYWNNKHEYEYVASEDNYRYVGDLPTLDEAYDSIEREMETKEVA